MSRPKLSPEEKRRRAVEYARRWQDKMLAANRCRECGASRKNSPYKYLCLTCQRKKRVAERKKLGNRPWKPGGRGRAPIKP